MKSKSMATCCGVFALTLMSVVNAQTPPPAGPAPTGQAATDPTRLPGDGPLPPLSFMLNPTPPPANAPRPASPPPAASPSLPLALEAAQAALDSCTAQGLKVGVVVTDAGGQIRAALTADGTSPGRVYTAIRKALTAIEFKAPTSTLKDKLAADPSAAARIKPNMAAFAGAVPLMVGDKVIGAIAASGARADQDEACAAAGLAKIKSKLK